MAPRVTAIFLARSHHPAIRLPYVLDAERWLRGG